MSLCGNSRLLFSKEGPQQPQLVLSLHLLNLLLAWVFQGINSQTRPVPLPCLVDTASRSSHRVVGAVVASIAPSPDPSPFGSAAACLP